jgi:asparagine synthase (glutamine-hydrolysing)
MCGIAGIVSEAAVQQAAALHAMVAALSHRGPDASGHYVLENVALGHRRLSIVDLEGGNQPMLGRGGSTAITFNGEIYGYKDVKATLGGYPFRTSSDTEVLLALYERYGLGFVSRVPGMFAFALWDEKEQRLVCGRDRFGEKPFFYAITPNGTFVFASEIKAILASGLIEPELSQEAVRHYLQRQYVHPYTTIYRNISVLPPAHQLVYQAGRVSVSRYWTLPAPNARISIDAAAEHFEHLLRQAVRRQLVADVPVGAFLSGGLDSTTIVCCAKEEASDIQTFSFDFLGRHSEIEYARAAAQKYGTRHVELSAASIKVPDLLLKMCEVYDEPFADSSSIPTYLLSREARKHTKVVLTGDGGDELLGGYAWYGPLAWMEATTAPRLWRMLIAKVASRVCRSLRAANMEQAEQRALGLSYRRSFHSVLAAHRAQLAFFSDTELTELGIRAAPTTATGIELLNCPNESLDAAIRFDLTDYMPGDILTKIDRASMAHGLELRAPFLDVDLATFCIALPASLKVGTDGDKRLLRRAFESRWPESIRGRSKQGFGAPMAEWLARDDVCELLRDSEEVFAQHSDVVDQRAAHRLLHHGTPAQRWSLAILAIWLSTRQRAVI